MLNAIDLAPLDKYEQIDFVPFDPTVKRTEATIKGPDGKVFKVTKGAPHVLLEMTYNKDDIRKEVRITVLVQAPPLDSSIAPRLPSRTRPSHVPRVCSASPPAPAPSSCAGSSQLRVGVQ